MNSRTTTGALALVAILVSLLATVAPPAAAEDPITVTWPTVTSFNPEAYDYVVDIAYDGPGTLSVYTPSTGDSQPAEPGQNHLPVQTNTSGFVVYLCSPTCAAVSTSPRLLTWTSMRIAGGSPVLGPQTVPFQRVARNAELADPPISFDLDWSVTPADDPAAAPVLTGTARDVTAFPALGAADELAQGQSYVYAAHITTTGAEWGNLEDEASEEFVWDATVPSVTAQVGVMRDQVFQSASRFYPVEDNYEDRLVVHVSTDPADPAHRASLRITAADGSVVERLASHALDGDRGDGSWNVSWSGRISAREFVPEGSYVLDLRVEDLAGNATLIQRTVEVSHDRRTRVRWVRTFRAAPTIIRSKVGSCARLLKPARKRWRGSTGYRSGQDCGRAQAAELWTMNAVHVPTSPFRRYEGMRVTVNGGAAAGSTPAAPVLMYLDNDDEWCCEAALGPQLGAHRGPFRSGNQAIHDVFAEPHTRPYVIWAVLAGAGLRYDVRSFTVRVDYYALR
ncbi:MAG TPA: hypothetical protein VNS55_04755 [Nocardioides sp.]|nr:hypothetical protein [Nocardioides sp.]